MTHDELRDRLEAGGRVIAGLIVSVGEAEASWRPAEDRWTLLEIVNHLADEERVDFRQRLGLIHADPANDWPAFNALAGIDDGEYSTREFGESVARWEGERASSLEWLDSLAEIDPGVLYTGRGSDRVPVTAGDLMSSWVAHDFFHQRQIIRLRWDYLISDEWPYSPLYAGTEE